MHVRCISALRGLPLGVRPEDAPLQRRRPVATTLIPYARALHQPHRALAAGRSTFVEFSQAHPGRRRSVRTSSSGARTACRSRASTRPIDRARTAHPGAAAYTRGGSGVAGSPSPKEHQASAHPRIRGPAVDVPVVRSGSMATPYARGRIRGLSRASSQSPVDAAMQRTGIRNERVAPGASGQPAMQRTGIRNERVRARRVGSTRRCSARAYGMSGSRQARRVNPAMQRTGIRNESPGAGGALAPTASPAAERRAERRVDSVVASGA